VDAETIRMAEYQLFHGGGIKPGAVEEELRKGGFSSVDMKYRWFPYEGRINKKVSEKNVKRIERLLFSVKPISKYLFKVVYFEARK
jgi:hypothetical protein